MANIKHIALTGLPALVFVLTITSNQVTLAATCQNPAFCNGGNAFGAPAILGTNDANSLTLRTSNAPRLTIDTSGSVGIGTTSPTPGYKLDVNGPVLLRSQTNISGNLGLGNPSPVARLHIGSSTGSEAIGAIFELPPNPMTSFPLIQWQGGGSGYGNWRNYINHLEKGFLLTYNMAYDYASNQFGDRDVLTQNTAFLWYDGLEGAYNFWLMGFGASMVGQPTSNVDEGGNFSLRQGGNGLPGWDNAQQGVVPTIFQVKSPSNADAVYQLVAARGATGVAFVASGDSAAPNRLSILGYNPGSFAPCTTCTNPPPPEAVKTVMTMHTDTGDITAPTGDLAISAQSKGLILKATDGPNCYRVTVNNAGTLSTASVSCP